MKYLRASVPLVLTLVLTACSGGSGGTIKYVVDAQCGRADVTYATAGGGTSQQSNTNGVVYESEFFSRGDFLYISAQNACDWGVISVKILSNGQTREYEWSSGAYVIATASGTY